MKRYKTAKLYYDRVFDRFIIVEGIDIIADSLDEAIDYCEENHPDLVVCGEHVVSSETLRIGRHKFNFNYN